MKKTIVFILIVACLFTVLISLAGCGRKSFDATDEYFGYDLLSNGTFSISAKDPQNLPFDIIIPETFDGIKITQISKKGFKGCKQIISVRLTSNINKIGSRAFQDCDLLTDLYIEDGLYSVGSYAFQNCTSFKKIYYNGTQYDWNTKRYFDKWGWMWKAKIGSDFTIIYNLA